jgi:integrase
VAYEDRDLVFCTALGHRLNPDWVSKRFQALARGVGLHVIRFHDLRHSNATLALQAGIHPKIISDRLGHATVAITLDTYSHAIPELQSDAAEKMAALVVPTGGAVER